MAEIMRKINEDVQPSEIGLLQSKVAILENENAKLKADKDHATKVAEDSEKHVEELRQLIELQPLKKRIRRTAAEVEAERATQVYSETKSNGQRKASPAVSIKSYDDFKKVQDVLKEKNIRDWMMWTVGVSLGIRVSDLLSLKIEYFLEQSNDEDGTCTYKFRKRLKIYEKKTSKLNDILITESVKEALTTYFDSIGWDFEMTDYLFISRKTRTKMTEIQGWRILNAAGKAAGLSYEIGTHTMRKSFANIVVCVDKSTVDSNSVSKIQGLLNHSDPRVTMRYLGTYKTMYDKARETVSDFVLGKSDVNELVAGEGLHSIEDLFDKMESIEALMGANMENINGKD